LPSRSASACSRRGEECRDDRLVPGLAVAEHHRLDQRRPVQVVDVVERRAAAISCAPRRRGRGGRAAISAVPS
jgi:hypothetical protein